MWFCCPACGGGHTAIATLRLRDPWTPHIFFHIFFIRSCDAGSACLTFESTLDGGTAVVVVVVVVVFLDRSETLWTAVLCLRLERERERAVASAQALGSCFWAGLTTVRRPACLHSACSPTSVSLTHHPGGVSRKHAPSLDGMRQNAPAICRPMPVSVTDATIERQLPLPLRVLQ